MAEEFKSICKDCAEEFGYSGASLQSGNLRGLTRPERCPKCRKLHSRESKSIGIPQIPVMPTCHRKPDEELQAGRLGKLTHPPREHVKVELTPQFGSPDCSIEFGITDGDILELFNALERYQVVVVVGPTGSGKSTFLPFRLMSPPEGIEKDRITRYGQIVITQPRIQATRKVAEFVSRDLHGSSLGAGFDVGFRHKDAPASDWRNKLVYVTDGTLINWIVSGQIASLSLIMIDEAHERSLNIDLILGLLKQQLPKYPHLKLIIASATINADLFRNYYGGPEKAELLTFRGLKQYSVEAYFPDHGYPLKRFSDAPRLTAEKIEGILLSIENGSKCEGDILGFLPGEGYIEKCAELIRGMIIQSPKLSQRDINVYPLYTSLPREVQDRALEEKVTVITRKIIESIKNFPDGRIAALFLDDKSVSKAKGKIQEAIDEEVIDKEWIISTMDSGGISVQHPRQIVLATHELFDPKKRDGFSHIVTDRRVILSTNVAETSLTVDGIVYVVDSGLVKQGDWDSEHAAGELPLMFHSRAGCRQRWGRAGRVRDGEAHAVYTDLQFENEFAPYTEPEIRRSRMESLILKAKAAGIDDISTFNWIEPPPEKELSRADSVLRKTGAIDEEGDLTAFGKEIESLTTELPIAEMLIAADQYACGIEMSTLAAMIQQDLCRGVFKWDNNWNFTTKQVAENARFLFCSVCLDDLEAVLKAYSVWAEAENEAKRDFLCRLFFIDSDRISKNAAPMREQLLTPLTIGKKGDEDRMINFNALNRLKMVIAATVPPDFVFRIAEDGRITPYYEAINGNSVCSEDADQLPVLIDAGSRLAAGPPSCFVALRKRISIGKTGDRQLSLSYLFEIKPEWLAFRNMPFLKQVLLITQEDEKMRHDKNPGFERFRVFIDVFYPLGSVYRLQKNDNGHDVPVERLEDPMPFEPQFDEERTGVTDIESDLPAKDVDPSAGTYKSDLIAFDSDDLGLETASSSDNALQWPDDAESKDVVGAIEMKTGLLCAKEVYEAQKIIPEVRLTASSETCMVSGYELSEDGIPKLVMSESTTRKKSPLEGFFNEGDEITVIVETVVESSMGEKALKVLEEVNNISFVVQISQLSFMSHRENLSEYPPGLRLQMKVIQLQGGLLTASCLPLLERVYNKFLANKPEKFKVKYLGGNRCAIQDSLFEGMPYFAKIKMSGSYRKPGDEIEVAADFKYPGQADVPLYITPNGLSAHIELHKTRMGVFLNIPRKCIHTVTPMPSKVRDELLGISECRDYQAQIRRLYRFSNIITVKPSDAKGYTGLSYDRGTREIIELEPARDYKVGEKVDGVITAVYQKYANVSLLEGGRGSVSLKHIASRKLLDAREVIYADQEVKATVTGRNSGNGSYHLSLISQEEDPVFKYPVDSVIEVSVTEIRGNGLVVKLDMHCEGFIPENGMGHTRINKIEDVFKVGDSFNARVIRSEYNNEIGRQPYEILLIAKQAEVIRMSVTPEWKNKIYQNIDRVRRIEREFKCSCSVNVQGTEAVIYGRDISLLKKAEQILVRELSYHEKIIHVPEGKVAKVIGKEQSTRLGIERETGCSVSVGDGGKVILSAPDESSLGKAELMIQHIVDGRQFIERTIKVHEHNVGLVIGPGFSNLKMIQEKTGCLIQHGNGGDFFVRARSEEALKRAEEMIKESASSARTYSMTILIPIEKKKILCGPHYKQILRIKKESGTQIDVEDDGKILISSKIQKNLDVAFQLIKNIVTEARMEDITQRRG